MAGFSVHVPQTHQEFLRAPEGTGKAKETRGVALGAEGRGGFDGVTL